MLSNDTGNECVQCDNKFCYLGGMISARVGVHAISITRVWNKVNVLQADNSTAYEI